MTSWLRLLLCASVLAWTAMGRSARADEPKKPLVEIVATGAPEVTTAVEVVVRELLTRLSVRLEWSIATGIDPNDVLAHRAVDTRVLARAWMDLSDRRRARIYVANAESERFLVRFVPIEHGYDEVARETLGHIVESAVDAFLAGGDVGVTREVAAREVSRERPPTVTPPPPPPPPVGVVENRPPPPPAERARFGLALVYGATLLGSDPIAQHGPALGFSFSAPARGKLRFSALAWAAYDPPFTWNGPSVGARFEGGQLAVLAGAEVSLTRALVVRALAGAGAGTVRVTPFAEGGDATTPVSPFWHTFPIATATLSADMTITGPLAVLLGAGCDLDLSGTSYDLLRDGHATHVLSPWVVRPLAYLGVVVSLDGPR